ncbi:MAG: HTH-type transcriptional activator IlvY [Cellvibrio sp.]|jgi:Transcriptional regulator
MDITKLKLFCALADTLHFGRAAALCHMSPSTVSRRIKHLEEDLGVSLFERDNRSVALTHEGQSFLLFAREVLLQWDTYQESLLAQADQLRGQLSIYCSVTASYSFLFNILTEFRVSHPGIAIKLHTGDPAQSIERVLAGNEDIAIAAKPEKLPAGLSFKLIARSPLIFIAPRNEKAWQPSAPTARDFWLKVPMILSEEGLARERLDQWFAQQHIKPNIYAEVKGNEAIVSMVSLGFGIGVLPKIVLDNSPLADRVQPLRHQPDLGPYDLGICVMERRLKSPIISAFWQQLPAEDVGSP